MAGKSGWAQESRPRKGVTFFQREHLFTVFLFPYPIEGGSNQTLAQLIPQNEPFSTGSEATVAGEVERLAGRRMTCAESEAASALANGCSVWADGLRPESLAHIALGLAAAKQLRVLFVSPSNDLLEHRQLRLGRRGPCLFARDALKQPAGTQGFTIWATPDSLDSALLGRLFGAQGPHLVVIEEAESCTSDSVSFRPSWSRLGALIKRWSHSRLLISTHSSSSELRKKISEVLQAKQFSVAELPAEATKPGDAIAICESTYLAPSRTPLGSDVRLRVEPDEGQSVAKLIGPLPRPALVLCSTPAQADQVFAELEEEQIPVHRFHSGLSATERSRELVHFALPGRRAVMVAVSAFGPSNGFAGTPNGTPNGDLPEAFGRGYAREDLRSIVHLCAPCSLLQYAQELSLLAPPLHASEAPRLELASVDGDDAMITTESSRSSDVRPTSDFRADRSIEQRPKVALMLFNPSHLALNLALLERKRPTPESLTAVVDQFLCHAANSWIEEKLLAQATGGSGRDASVCLRFLEDAGAIQRQGTQLRTKLDIVGFRQVAKQLGVALLALIQGDEPRLQEVEDYAESRECRSATLSRLFGRQQFNRRTSDEAVSCGHCDICAPGGVMSAHGVADIASVDDSLPFDDEFYDSMRGDEESVLDDEILGGERLGDESLGDEMLEGKAQIVTPLVVTAPAVTKKATRKAPVRRNKRPSPGTSATPAPVTRQRVSS